MKAVEFNIYDLKNERKVKLNPGLIFESYQEYVEWQQRIDALKAGLDIAKPCAGNKRIGLAYPAFVGEFKRIYPDIEVIDTWSQAKYYDLIIFSGGGDVEPALYGQHNTMSGGIDHYRDESESNVLRYAMDSNRTKILAICRGHQLVNVRLGGSLWQDFVYEGEKEFHPSMHKLEFAPGVTPENSVICKFFKDKWVTSYHHQAVRNIGSGLKSICGYKGTNEGVESSKIISVQFHPEFDYENCVDFFNFINKEW